MNAAHGIIIYDCVCVLCWRYVQFVIARDRDAFFRFVPIQSDRGRVLAELAGIDPETPDSFAVFIDGRPLLKSDGVLAILSRLPRYGWTTILRLVPRVLRNLIYDRIARSRYRIFGRADSCIMPDVSVRARFEDLDSAQRRTGSGP